MVPDRALAISGLPLLNGFPSEWLTFQALLRGLHPRPGLVRLNFPLTAALLALTSALAAACFVRAFGISFLALPRAGGIGGARVAGRDARATRLSCDVVRDSGAVSRFVLRALEGVTASLPGLQPPAAMMWDGLGMSSGLTSFDHVVPAMFGLAFLGGLIGSTALTGRRAVAVRQAPVGMRWGADAAQ